MANKRGWWKLTITPGDCEPDDIDLDHIARMVRDGYTEGELVKTGD